MYKFVLTLILFLCWIALSGITDPFFLIAGLASSFFAVSIFKILNLQSSRHARRYITFKWVGYLRWLVFEVAKSSIKMSNIIWSANLKLNPYYGWVYTKQEENIGRTTYANSITLTPGTLTIYTQNDRLFVHSIDKDNMEDLNTGEMDHRIKCLSSNKVSNL